MLNQNVTDVLHNPDFSFFTFMPEYPTGVDMNNDNDRHVPVLERQILDWLITDKNGIYFDGTMGDGGHSRAIAEILEGKGKIIATDWDERAVKYSESWRKPLKTPVTVIHSNYSEMPSILSGLNIKHITGILLDLGLSSRQLDDPERGFSYRYDSPLDMRMDERLSNSARELLNNSGEKELRDIFYRFGEERRSSRLARLIVEAREKTKFNSTQDLVEIMKKRWHPSNYIKSASRIFQALRIAVNNELDSLNRFLEDCWDYLNPGGRIAVISYHSLEDRLVKQAFKQREKPCVCPRDFPICTCGKKPDAKVLTRKAVTPSNEEIKQNSRARSAKLRVAEKII